jgi:hypothetical protein
LLLDFIEHLFGRDVPFEFGQFRAIAIANANAFGQLRDQLKYFSNLMLG